MAQIISFFCFTNSIRVVEEKMKTGHCRMKFGDRLKCKSMCRENNESCISANERIENIKILITTHPKSLFHNNVLWDNRPITGGEPSGRWDALWGHFLFLLVWVYNVQCSWGHFLFSWFEYIMFNVLRSLCPFSPLECFWNVRRRKRDEILSKKNTATRVFSFHQNRWRT